MGKTRQLMVWRWYWRKDLIVRQIGTCAVATCKYSHSLDFRERLMVGGNEKTPKQSAKNKQTNAKPQGIQEWTFVPNSVQNASSIIIAHIDGWQPCPGFRGRANPRWKIFFGRQQRVQEEP